MAEDQFKLAEWTVRPSELMLESSETSLRLEPKAMAVLQLLAARAPDVVSMEELLAEVWSGTVVGHDAVYRAIKLLRRAFGDKPRSPRFIESIAKKGYRLKVEVEQGSGRSAQPVAAIPEPVVGHVLVALEMNADPPPTLKKLATETARYLAWNADAFKVQLQPRNASQSHYLIRLEADAATETRFRWELFEQQVQTIIWSGDHVEALNEGTLRRVAEILADGAADQIRRHKIQELSVPGANANNYWGLILTSDKFEGVSAEAMAGRRERLKTAIGLFPKLAPAYAAYAELCSAEILNGSTDDPKAAYKEAQAAVAEAVELDRDGPYVLSRCGAVLARLGDLQRGAELCQRAVDLAPTASTKEALARVLTFSGEPDRAIPLLREIMDTTPQGHVFVWGKLVVPLMQKGDLEAAMPYSVRMISSYPNDFFAWVLHCSLAFQLGDEATGLKAWEEVQRLSPGLSIDDAIAATAKTYARIDEHRARLTDGLVMLKDAL